MDKISSILPTSPRVKTVDMEESHPIRPGTPAFGRPNGSTSSERDRVSISPMAKENAFSETMAKRNPRAEPGGQIPDKMAEKFFAAKAAQMAPAQAEEAESEHITEAVHEAPANVRTQYPTPGAEVSGHALNKYA